MPHGILYLSRHRHRLGGWRHRLLIRVVTLRDQFRPSIVLRAVWFNHIAVFICGQNHQIVGGKNIRGHLILEINRIDVIIDRRHVEVVAIHLLVGHDKLALLTIPLDTGSTGWQVDIIWKALIDLL